MIHKAYQNQRVRFIVGDPKEVFEKYGGAFYLMDADIVIGTMHDLNKIWIHPNSERSVKLKARPKLKTTESMGIELYINDNKHVFDKAFMNIAGEVLEIPITRNPSEPDVITTWFDVHTAGTKPKHYEFDDKTCPVKIYRSRSEAAAGGEPDKLIERDILQEKSRLAKEKADFEREEFERQRIKAEETAKRAKEQAEQLERDRIKEQSHREQQHKNNERVEKTTFWRKFIVEGVKTAAAVAACVTTVVAWYMKSKTS